MLSNDSHRILILGHSFVWRLEKFLRGTPLPCIDWHLSSPPPLQVKFYGVGGRTVHRLHTSNLHVVSSFQPHLVILEIGSNDLSNPHIPVPLLAANILQLNQNLHYNFNVAHIILMGVCERNHPPLTQPPYNVKAHQLNHTMLQMIKPIPFVSFWFHRRLTRYNFSFLLPDGVHFNPTGNHLLYHSYKSAILRYLRHKFRRTTNSRRFVSPRPLTWTRRPQCRIFRSRQCDRTSTQ